MTKEPILSWIEDTTSYTWIGHFLDRAIPKKPTGTFEMNVPQTHTIRMKYVLKEVLTTYRTAVREKQKLNRFSPIDATHRQQEDDFLSSIEQLLTDTDLLLTPPEKPSLSPKQTQSFYQKLLVMDTRIIKLLRDLNTRNIASIRKQLFVRNRLIQQIVEQ